MKLKDVWKKKEVTLSFEAFPPKKDRDFASVASAVEKIAQLENLTVTDEEMDAAIQRICADNHMSAEDLKPYFDNGFLTVVRQQMLRDKATEVVRRSAQITQ